MQDIARNEEHFSEAKFQTFLRGAARIGRKVIEPAVKLYHVMMADSTPLDMKALIAAGLGYLILPADLIPDVIPALGFTDDLAVILGICHVVECHVTPEVEQEVKATLDAIF